METALNTPCMPSAPDVVVKSLDMQCVRLKAMASGAWRVLKDMSG
jgi:hypothetical protein